MASKDEMPGVDLYSMPEWAAQAVTSYSAIDQVYTAIKEDERLEAYGVGSMTERRAHFMKEKEQAQFTGMVLGAMTGALVIQKDVWSEPPELTAASPEDKAEFYARHVYNMKRRIENFTRNLTEGGKKAPKRIITRSSKGFLFLDVEKGELYRVPVKSMEVFGKKIGTLSLKEKIPAEDADWFRVRWEDEILEKTKGISGEEKMAIVATVNLP